MYAFVLGMCLVQYLKLPSTFWGLQGNWTADRKQFANSSAKVNCFDGMELAQEAPNLSLSVSKTEMLSKVQKHVKTAQYIIHRRKVPRFSNPWRRARACLNGLRGGHTSTVNVYIPTPLLFKLFGNLCKARAKAWHLHQALHKRKGPTDHWQVHGWLRCQASIQNHPDIVGVCADPGMTDQLLYSWALQEMQWYCWEQNVRHWNSGLVTTCSSCIPSND